MRVLFSSTWGYGHIFPMIPLARAFVAAGHEVRWATSAESCAQVSAAGLQAVECGLFGPLLKQVRDRAFVEGSRLRPEHKAAFVFSTMFGRDLTPPMLADLLPLAREWRPDLLVHEHGELAAPLAGEVLGIPTVTHSFGGAVPVPILAGAGELLAPLWAEYGRQITPYAGCFTLPYLDICPPAVQSVGIEHIGAVQPLRPVSYTGDQVGPLPPCLTEDGDPLVYLTLGTVMNQAVVLRAAVEGLSGLEVRVLVTVGPTGDPAALGPQPPNVTVERFVAQTEVLPRCTAVVSHAGSGTFLGALAEGRPQVCIPQAADQFRNATGVLNAGAGLSLHPDNATPEAIGAATVRILAEGSFRTAAEAVGADIAAMPSPDEVVSALVRLA